MFGWLRSLRSDRYVHIGCVALHPLHLLRCVRCIQIVTYTSVTVRCTRCVRYVEIDIYRSQRTHRLRWLRCIRYVALGVFGWLRSLRCVACVAFVAYRSLRTRRLRCVACVGCIRIVTYRADPLRCVRLRLSTTPARSVKDCQKKLNLTPFSLPLPPAGSDQKPVFFRGCRSFAQPKKLFLWKDRTLFGGCIGSAKR